MTYPRKILVIRFSSIGDIVLTTSPLTTLKKYFHESQIDFLTLSHFSPLLENHPYINTLLTLEKSARYSEIKAVGKFINTSDYDLVIDLHNSLRSKIIRRELRSVQTRTLIKPRWNRFKLFQFHLNNFPDNFSQRWLLHQPIIDLMAEGEIPPTILTVANIEQRFVLDWLRSLGVEGDYIVLIPGAAWKQKIWSARKYGALIRTILENYKLDIVMVGATADNICTELSDDFPQLLNLQGQTDLRETLAIISQAKIAIGSDTGFIHAAEALQVPTVMILGPTSQETGAESILQDSIKIEVDNLWCRPCSQAGDRPCYRSEQQCLRAITPSDVWTQMESILAV